MLKILPNFVAYVSSRAGGKNLVKFLERKEKLKTKQLQLQHG
jgi:hypothetical protein